MARKWGSWVGLGLGLRRRPGSHGRCIRRLLVRLGLCLRLFGLTAAQIVDGARTRQGASGREIPVLSARVGGRCVSGGGGGRTGSRLWEVPGPVSVVAAAVLCVLVGSCAAAWRAVCAQGPSGRAGESYTEAGGVYGSGDLRLPLAHDLTPGACTGRNQDICD